MLRGWTSCSNDECRPECERGERQRRELPVPIDRCMHERGDIGARGHRHQRMVTSPRSGGKWNRESNEKQYEPYRAELRERLQVQVVRVEDAERHGAIAQPIATERIAAATQQGMVPNLMPGRGPVVRPRMSRQRDEPPVEVAAGDGAVSSERIRCVAHETDRVPDPDESRCGDCGRGDAYGKRTRAGSEA